MLKSPRHRMRSERVGHPTKKPPRIAVPWRLLRFYFFRSPKSVLFTDAFPACAVDDRGAPQVRVAGTHAPGMAFPIVMT